MESDNDRVSALVSGSVAGALEHLQSQMEQYERDHAFEDNVTIHSGHLYKTGQGFLGGTWQLRYFELKMHTLVYKTEKGEQRVIDLSKGCTLTDEAVAASRSFKGQALTTFSIIPHKAGRIYSIGGANPQEVLNWKDAIRTQIFRTPLKFGGVKRFDARVSLHEGFLWKLGESKIRKWNKRYFVLFSDSLQYYREWEESKPAGVIMLTVGSSLKLIHNTEKSGLERIFRLFDVCPHPGSQKSKGWLASNRTYHIACAEQALLDVWVEKIQNQIPLTSRVMNGVFQPASFSTFLLKRNHIHRNGKQYRFELSISNLQYFDEKDKLAGSFGIHEIQSVNPDVSANRRFTISLKEKGKLVKLEAFTREECSEWVQRLDAIIRANIDFKESDLVKEEEEQVNSVKQLVMSIKLRCRDTFFHPMFVKVSCTGSRTREQIQQRERAEAELAQAEDGGRSLRGKKKSRIAARSLPGPFEHKLDEVGALPTGPTLSRYNSQPSHKKSMTVDSFSVVPALESKVDADSSSRFDCDANSDGDETVQNAISDLDETAVEFSSDSDYSDEGDAEKDWKEFVPADPLQSRKQDIYHSLEFLGITPVTSFDTRCAEELIGWYDGTWREVMKTEMLWRQDRSHQGEYAFKILFTFDVDQLEVFMQQQQQQEQEDAEGECKRARVDGDNDVALFRFDIIENQGREIMDSYVKSRAEKLVAAVKIPSEEIWKLYDGSKREVFSNIKVPHQQIDRDVLCLTRIEVRSVNECGNGKFRNRSYLFVDKDQQHVVVHEQLQRSPFTFSAPCSLLEHYLRLYETRKMLIEKQIEVLSKRIGEYSPATSAKDANKDVSDQEAHNLFALNMLRMRLGKLYQTVFRYKRLVLLYRNNRGHYRNHLFKPSSSKSDHALQFVATNLHLHSMLARTLSADGAVLNETSFEYTTVGAFAAHNMKFKKGGTLKQNEHLTASLDQVNLLQSNKDQKSHSKSSHLAWSDDVCKDLGKLHANGWELNMRKETVFTQAASAVLTSFCAHLLRHMDDEQVLTGIAECGFLVEVESLLSSIGNENGMIMDKVYATRSLKNVQFALVCQTADGELPAGLPDPILASNLFPTFDPFCDSELASMPEELRKRPEQLLLDIQLGSDLRLPFSKFQTDSSGAFNVPAAPAHKPLLAVLAFPEEMFRKLPVNLRCDPPHCKSEQPTSSNLGSPSTSTNASYIDMSRIKVFWTYQTDGIPLCFPYVLKVAPFSTSNNETSSPTSASTSQPTPTNPTYPLPNNNLISVTPIFLSRGVNEQQWIANKRSKINVKFEDTHTKINEKSLEDLRGYYMSYRAKLKQYLPSEKQKEIEESLNKLDKVVAESKENYDNDDLSLLEVANFVVRQLGGSRVVCCKSAKDRTSMSVTLQQVRHLNDKHDLGTKSKESEGQDPVLRLLRTYGVRRDNVVLNTGKPYFAFNTVQSQFLPRDLKPPQSTRRTNES